MNRILLKSLVNEVLYERNVPTTDLSKVTPKVTPKVNKNGTNSWSDFPEADDIPFPETDAGIGDGEKKLAKILGGDVMGPSVSYDIAIPNKANPVEKWEVKHPSKKEIKAGTQGVRIANHLITMVSTVATEMDEFIELAYQKEEKIPAEFLGPATPLYEEVRNFIRGMPYEKSAEKTGSAKTLKTNYDLLTSGEITKNTLNRLIMQVQNVQKISEMLQKNVLKIKYNDQEFQVSPAKMLKISKILGLQDDKGSEDTTGGVDAAVALSVLMHPAFDNPQLLSEKWNEIAASKVFEGVKGVILVDAKGFECIQSDQLDSRLEFSRISMGTTKFKVK